MKYYPRAEGMDSPKYNSQKPSKGGKFKKANAGVASKTPRSKKSKGVAYHPAYPKGSGIKANTQQYNFSRKAKPEM